MNNHTLQSSKIAYSHITKLMKIQHHSMKGNFTQLSGKREKRGENMPENNISVAATTARPVSVENLNLIGK